MHVGPQPIRNLIVILVVDSSIPQADSGRQTGFANCTTTWASWRHPVYGVVDAGIAKDAQFAEKNEKYLFPGHVSSTGVRLLPGRNDLQHKATRLE